MTKEQYNQRLNKYNIASCNTAFLKEILKGKNQKFYRDGRLKPFYGLTCIVRINDKNELFYNLIDLQNKIKESLESEGFGRYFSFLAPQSLHMTICDIEADPAPVQVAKIDARVKQLREAFNFRNELPKHVFSQISELGLKETITALVKFDEGLESELEKILSLEAKIKEAMGVNIREFTGHISLAYFVQNPGNKLERIKDILLNFQLYKPLKFTFSQFDFVYFTDMNNFLPIITINLEKHILIPHMDKLNIAAEL